MNSFESDHSYLARCGESVQIERRSGSRLYGKAFKRQIELCWNLDGTHFPKGGIGPYDLIRPDRAAGGQGEVG